MFAVIDICFIYIINFSGGSSLTRRSLISNDSVDKVISSQINMILISISENTGVVVFGIFFNSSFRGATNSEVYLIANNSILQSFSTFNSTCCILVLNYSVRNFSVLVFQVIVGVSITVKVDVFVACFVIGRIADGEDSTVNRSSTTCIQRVINIFGNNIGTGVVSSDRSGNGCVMFVLIVIGDSLSGINGISRIRTYSCAENRKSGGSCECKSENSLFHFEFHPPYNILRSRPVSPTAAGFFGLACLFSLKPSLVTAFFSARNEKEKCRIFLQSCILVLYH